MSNPVVPQESEAFHRLSARLARLDLDPATLEMLIAVLNVDLDLSDEAPETVSTSG